MKSTLLIIFTFITALSFAQKDNKRNKHPIEKVIVAYMTKNLSLTADEADAFMPIFKNYMKDHRTATITNKNDEIKKNEAVLEVQKKYKPQFLTILKTEDRANKVFRLHQQLIVRLKSGQEKRKAKLNTAV
jgi:hypothetical protein